MVAPYRRLFRMGWALACLPGFSSIVSFAETESCFLTINVVDSFDPSFELQARVAAYRLVESRRLQQIDLITGKPEPLECGTYVLRVRPSSGDFRGVSRVVEVRHGMSRSVTVGVPLQIGDEEVGDRMRTPHRPDPDAETCDKVGDDAGQDQWGVGDRHGWLAPPTVAFAEAAQTLRG